MIDATSACAGVASVIWLDGLRGLGHHERGRLRQLEPLRPHHPAGDPAVDLVEELVHEDVGRDLLEHAPVRVDEARLTAARDPEVGVARLARAVDRAAHDGDLEGLRVRREPRPPPASARFQTPTLSRPHEGQAIMTGPRSRRPSAFRISQATLTSSTGSAVSETRIVSPIPSMRRRAHADSALDRARERRARPR